MKPYDLSDMDVEALDRLLVLRPDLKKEIEEARERAECEHDEHDHGYCLACGRDIHGDLEGRADDLI